MGYSSRKYVDLIRSCSSKWANWDPPNEIQVGDYGVIDRKSGQLEIEGNIYRDGMITSSDVEHRPIRTPKDDKYIISSSGVRFHELNLGPEISTVAGLAEASIKGRWEFGKESGALLVMAQSRSCRISDHGTLLKRLFEKPELNGKSLVTEVVTCPAYALYLSGSDRASVSLALIAGIPGVVPGATVGGEVGMSWWSQHASGVFREACDPSGSYCYTPLYTLKKKRGWFRGDAPQPGPEGESLWVDVPTPWGGLNEEGEEGEEWEDTVFDL
ncbi:hypothetical protein BDZ94DRAFT_1258086 [Collybia nuda]|uniref:Uncharacterized protein n=1 Tax=Collybia nuda TaxID=64659 RepID=A0A9P5Y6Y0_9AGAR|nr:hypothetical protein BDZ94DRAFT_1258086 [Collybia nuda]